MNGTPEVADGATLFTVLEVEAPVITLYCVTAVPVNAVPVKPLIPAVL